MSISSVEAIVLAAGKGKRMRSKLPKVLHRCCGNTLLERTLKAIAGTGAKRVVVVIGYGAELVEAELSRVREKSWATSLEIVSAIQHEQLGTGHAAKVGLVEVSASASHILIVPADTPLLSSEPLKDLLSSADSSAALGFVTAEFPDPTGFGRVLRDNKSGDVLRLVEEKDCSEEEKKIREANVSLYLARAEFLRSSLESLSCENAQGEYYLTDIVSMASGQGLGLRAIPCADHRRVMGANSRVELSRLEKIARSEIIERLMDQGVTFEDPDSVIIDEDSTIGQDSFVGACSYIYQSQVGKDVHIEGHVQITGSMVDEGSRIRFGTVLEDAKVGPDCQLGPYARLRPGTELERDVRIGNFVETKKAKLAAGAKANHLSYIGDAVVGEKANIGAGTITCNYDGVNKNQTIIGPGAFIGSNTCLVAPVKVGEGAYIGAGSTISKDIPAHALGLERAERKIVEGWALKKNNSKQ